VRVTRFDVYFPAYHMGPLLREAKAKQQSLPVGTETILLAEDELDVREFAQRVLEGLGYRVLVAEDGATAVETFSANQQDVRLVVLDVVMPKVSGPKAYEAMSKLRDGVPVIYVSGYSESMAGMARQDTKVQMLLKPFSVEELGRRVRQALDETRKRSRLRARH
jgi:two-component system cell cycle sensor histidine kinase/response regulator CckA